MRIVPPLGRLYIRGHPPSTSSGVAAGFAVDGADPVAGVGFEGVWAGGGAAGLVAV
jgi:hypothetical protein